MVLIKAGKGRGGAACEAKSLVCHTVQAQGEKRFCSRALLTGASK